MKIVLFKEVTWRHVITHFSRKTLKIMPIISLGVMLATPIKAQPAPAKSQSAYDLCQQMLTSCRKIKTLTFTLLRKERVENEWPEDKSDFKLNCKPHKVYFKQDYPREGLELLFIDGANDNKALINTNGFPWVNVNLSPFGGQLRENQHHTLYEVGYKSVINILGFLWEKYESQAKSMVNLEGSVMWDGHDCYKIKMKNPNFKYINYTVKEGEDLNKIAKDLYLSEHMIMEKNSGVDYYDDVNAGQTITIPNDYATGMDIYLDKKRMIPLMIKVYDDQGLYEVYEYYSVTVNPPLSSEEFTSGYKDYGF